MPKRSEIEDCRELADWITRSEVSTVNDKALARIILFLLKRVQELEARS